jgi:anchored repeat-type ABC transporter ATP-binding subunit
MTHSQGSLPDPERVRSGGADRRPASASGLQVEELTVAYGSRVALDRVSLACAPGEIVGLLGPNGSGKSTLLKSILGLIPAASGTIRLDGQPLDRKRRSQIAYTPQRNEVDWTFPITVEEVAVLGRQGRRGLFGRPDRDDWRIARAALDRLSLSDLRRRPIGELSGGQQQRVFLARALAQEGSILLLDEPLTGVDAQTQAVVLDLITDLRRQGTGVLMTTHDLVQAAQVCDRVSLLNRRVIASGPPDEVLEPRVLMETYGGSEMLRVVDGVGLVGLPHGAGPESDHEHEDEHGAIPRPDH